MDLSRRRFFGSRPPQSSACRPPWSVAEAAFLETCSRCDDCVRVCPTALLRRGQGGFPEADFSNAACTFCGECASACTSGAISRADGRSAWAFTASVGDDCLARRRIECRVCGECCDAGAIRFSPVIGGVPVPIIDAAACTACGACLAPCPSAAIARVARASSSVVEWS